MGDMLKGFLALISGIAAIVTFWQFQKTGATLMMILGIIFIIATVVLGAMFLTGRVNKTEDIHITE